VSFISIGRNYLFLDCFITTIAFAINAIIIKVTADKTAKATRTVGSVSSIYGKVVCITEKPVNLLLDFKAVRAMKVKTNAKKANKYNFILNYFNFAYINLKIKN